MIVGFSKHGTGKGAGPVNYILDPTREGRQEHPPELVRGDHELTKNLIDASGFKHKYTSGVLSFAPDEKITEDMENKIIDRFEQAAFSGLNQDQYNILWVRHTHAGHHELHFVTPRVELSTGNSLNIKPPGKNTQDHYDNFRSEINARYGLADPDDPNRKRDISQPNHEIHIALKAHRRGDKTPNNLKAILNSYLSEKAVTGEIRGRNDVIDHTKELDLHIKREGKDYITVYDPESDKRFRMKGALYERDFTPSRAIEAAQAGRHRDYSKPSPQDAERFARAVDEHNQRKAQYHRQRYNKTLSKNDGAICMDTPNALSRPVRDDNPNYAQNPIHNHKRPSESKTDALRAGSEGRENRHFELQRENMHRDTPRKQSGVLPEQRSKTSIHHPEGTLDHDRTRKDLTERIARITNTIRNSTTTISELAKNLARGIQRNPSDESPSTQTNRNLRNTEQNFTASSQRLTESNRTIEHTYKKLNRSKTRSKGLSR